MTKSYAILLLLLLTNSALGQRKQSETEFLDSIIIAEYPKSIKIFDLFRLDTIDSTDKDYIRYWSDSQIITLVKDSNNIYFGSIINYIERLSQNKRKNINPEFTIIKSINHIDPLRVKRDFNKTIELRLIEIPTESKINGWIWVALDSKAYIFEALINGNYCIKIYDAPELLADSIAYKNQILKLINNFDTNYKFDFDNFFNNLPSGSYRKEGSSTIITKFH